MIRLFSKFLNAFTFKSFALLGFVDKDGWKQFKRWQNFMEPRVDIDGTRPNPAVWYNAVSQQKMVTQDFGDWKPMGPYNAPGSSNSNGIGISNLFLSINL